MDPDNWEQLEFIEAASVSHAIDSEGNGLVIVSLAEPLLLYATGNDNNMGAAHSLPLKDGPSLAPDCMAAMGVFTEAIWQLQAIVSRPMLAQEVARREREG